MIPIPTVPVPSKALLLERPWTLPIFSSPLYAESKIYKAITSLKASYINSQCCWNTEFKEEMAGGEAREAGWRRSWRSLQLMLKGLSSILVAVVPSSFPTFTKFHLQNTLLSSSQCHSVFTRVLRTVGEGMRHIPLPVKSHCCGGREPLNNSNRGGSQSQHTCNTSLGRCVRMDLRG